MYSILQPHLQAVVSRRRIRMVSDIGFNPIRIDRGEEHSLIVGSDGEMLEIDSQKEQVSEGVMYPFPGVSSCGVVSSDQWIGSWVDRSVRKAYMGSFPLGEKWESADTDSGGSENRDVDQSVSKSASWTRELQSEPLAMCTVDGNIVFACLGSGIYMIDGNASEIWRSPYPRWRELEDLVGIDSIVSLLRKEDKIYAFSSSGGYSVISTITGHEINNGILSNLPDRVHDVRYDQDSGWIIMLYGKNMAVMSDLNSKPAIFRVPGPVMDVSPCEGGWKWTGWRHDGYLSNGRLSTFGRNEIGISLVGSMVLTNSGTWRIFKGDDQKFL